MTYIFSTDRLKICARKKFTLFSPANPQVPLSCFFEDQVNSFWFLSLICPHEKVVHFKTCFCGFTQNSQLN
jgi:hypothetical protein